MGICWAGATPREVTLALGGGGAKGFVHVGVIRELADEGILIRGIVGTSVGALVGAIYAYERAVVFGDKPPAEAQRRAVGALEIICLAENFGRFKDWNLLSPLRRGFVRGHALREWLVTALWNAKRAESIRFADLPFDFVVTATNAWTGDPIVLSTATTPAVQVAVAVRASASIQGVFVDTEVDTEGGKRVRCWDGGSTGNCRFDLALERVPDGHVLASSLTYRGEPISTEGSLFAIKRQLALVSHSAGILMRQIEDAHKSRLSKAENERLCFVTPDLGDIDTLDFALGPAQKRALFHAGSIAVRSKLGLSPSASPEPQVPKVE